MWIFTNYGFFSVVENGLNDKNVLVRARVRSDLENMLRNYEEYVLGLKGTKIIVTPDNDYPFRIDVPKDVFACIVEFTAKKIDYHNFKGEVLGRGGIDSDEYVRAHIYGEVWEVLTQLEGLNPPKHSR